MMPDLTGQFWADAEPRLRALGWTGSLDQGRQRRRTAASAANAVVTQSPPPGTAVKFDGTDHAELRVSSRPHGIGDLVLQLAHQRLGRRGAAVRPASWRASGGRPR